MTAVSIARKDGRWTVLLDGADLTSRIVDGGLSVDFPSGNLPPTVQVTLRADELTLNLDDAIAVMRTAGTRGRGE